MGSPIIATIIHMSIFNRFKSKGRNDDGMDVESADGALIDATDDAKKTVVRSTTPVRLLVTRPRIRRIVDLA